MAVTKICGADLWKPFSTLFRREVEMGRDPFSEFALRVLYTIGKHTQQRQHHFIVFWDSHLNLTE